MSEEVLSELQLITSMYNPSQFTFHDIEVALKVENGVPISGSVSLTLKPNDLLQLHLRLPEGYPHTERLSASCQIAYNSSAGTFGNTREKIESQLNIDLSTLLKSESEGIGTKDVLSVVKWINDRWDQIWMEEMKRLELNDSNDDNDKKTCRIWIHSHHIYNEKKRKFIINKAAKLDLNGFSLPGKPGFICVEGEITNCDDFWTQIRQLSWQKISLVEKQLLENSDQSIFTNFEELRLDMAGFMKYLGEKGVSSVIKDYLGFG